MIHRLYYLRAAELLARPLAWTHKAWARDVSRKPAHPRSPTAVMWDMDGAIKRVCPDDEIAYNLIQYNNYRIRYTVGVTLNDSEHFDQYRAVARLLATAYNCDTRASYAYADAVFNPPPSDLE